MDCSTLDNRVAFVQSNTLIVVQFDDDGTFHDYAVIKGYSSVEWLGKSVSMSNIERDKLLPTQSLARNRLSEMSIHLC
jgi:hypothetical protein